MLSKLMSRFWWVMLLRGVLAIVFGLLALTYPGMTLSYLVIFFAAYAFIDGVTSVLHAVSGRSENQSWWVLLLEGLLGIAIGVITFQAPEISALLLLLYIGLWVTSVGVVRIILAIRLRDEIEDEWWMILSGVVSVLFGLGLITRPAAGAIGLLAFIGIWSIIAGTFLVFFAIRLKTFGGNLEALKDKVGMRA
jgi:uncharacterized membrane protein HdeD (DUF308 family)